MNKSPVQGKPPVLICACYIYKTRPQLAGSRHVSVAVCAQFASRVCYGQRNAPHYVFLFFDHLGILQRRYTNRANALKVRQ